MKFLLDDTVLAARKLLGVVLVHDTPSGRISGMIVETEAYRADDAASHSYRGQTERNAVMFGPAGHLYVYFTYGMHFCVNVVTGQTGHGEAVLIRALEPLEGIECMVQNRGRSNNLTNGPAKLAQALGLDKRQNGVNLLQDDSAVKLETGATPSGITTTTRVGISENVDHPWRFYITNNPYISKR